MATIVAFSDTGPEPEDGVPGRVLAGSPRTSTRNYYADPAAKFFAGVWESTPGKWRVEYSEHELVHLLEGRIVLTDDHGHERRFGPGDVFVIPAGFAGTWETLERVRKLYAIYQP